MTCRDFWSCWVLIRRTAALHSTLLSKLETGSHNTVRSMFQKWPRVNQIYNQNKRNQKIHQKRRNKKPFIDMQITSILTPLKSHQQKKSQRLEIHKYLLQIPINQQIVLTLTSLSIRSQKIRVNLKLYILVKKTHNNKCNSCSQHRQRNLI